MATTKELRHRIKSISNTSKVTKAMEMVSAAKMRRAQDQALSGRAYEELINNVLKHMSSSIDPNAHPLLINKENHKEAVLLISTNRGLVGSLNTNLFRKTLDLAENTVFVTLGKKGSIYTSKTAKDLIADFALEDHPTLQLSEEIAKFLMQGYLAGNFNKVTVIFTDFQTTLSQVTKVQQILPIIDETVLENLKEEDRTEFLFEPSADLVLDRVLPHYVEMQLYQIMLEAAASEHSARMVAMKNATDNASELVEDLKLTYNQLRQANITSELLDISTAQAALE